MNGFFVTGTDTNIGKTVVSSILCLGLNGHYWKPVQTGSKSDSDSETVRPWAKSVFNEAYRFLEPLSPHTAAALENQEIIFEKILESTPQTNESLIVEGAGGLLVPLNREKLMIDLISKLKLPAILVCRSALGTLNHTLLSLEALRARKIDIEGLIMVGDENAANKTSLEFYGKVPVIAEIEFCQKMDRSWMLRQFQSFNFRNFRSNTSSGGNTHEYQLA